MTLRIALVAGLAALVGVSWWFGLYEQLTLARMTELMRDAGAFGPPLYVLAFAMGELVHVPGVLFVVGAPAFWPSRIAWPTAFAGALASATLGFVIARYLLADTIQRHLPARLRGLDERLARSGLRTVIAIRFATFLWPAAHWALGVSRVSARDYLLGTAIGVAPGVTLLVFAGDVIAGHWESAKPWLLGAAVALGLALAARLLVLRRKLG